MNGVVIREIGLTRLASCTHMRNCWLYGWIEWELGSDHMPSIVQREHRAAFVRALQRHVGRKPARSVGHVVALEDANERQICRRQENVQDKERPSLRAVRILCEYDQRGVLSNRVRDNPVLVVSEENVQENKLNFSLITQTFD